MNNLARTLPLALAIVVGLLTLLGILFFPAMGEWLTAWASFLAAVALVLGVLNLLGVHVRRLVKGNVYSGVLVFSMIIVFVLAGSDYLGFTESGVNTAFEIIQVPLEAAIASLLAFFLIFSGIRLLQRQRTWWAVLFLSTVVLLLLGSTMLPQVAGGVFGTVSEFISQVFVAAGMRGLLIGIALGAITVSLRILTGLERPYQK